jgi:hypothetical protein
VAFGLNSFLLKTGIFNDKAYKTDYRILVIPGSRNPLMIKEGST